MFIFFQTDCKPTDEKTTLSLVLDVDFSSLSGKEKVFIVKNWAEFLNIKKVSTNTLPGMLLPP